MTEKYVTLCVFHEYAHAREVANSLNEAGIPTNFSGDAASAAGLGFAPNILTLWLQVPESFLDRACSVLDSDDAAPKEEDDVPAAIAEDQEEESEDIEQPTGVVKELVSDAIGAILDKHLRNLNSTPSDCEPDATPPRTVWGALAILLFMLWLLIKTMRPILLDD